jgi:predicted DNA-binding transcriptional regulator AlpA
MTRQQHPTSPPGIDERWLRCREVADLLAVSERQVWRLAQSDGVAPPILEPTRLRMPGRSRPLTRWRYSEVQRLLEQAESA